MTETPKQHFCDVLQFQPRQKQEGAQKVEPLAVTIDFNGDGSVGGVHAHGVKDTASNLFAIASALEGAARIVCDEASSRDPDPDKRWVLGINLYASGREASFWTNDSIQTLRQWLWLRRRLKVVLAYHLGRVIRAEWVATKETIKRCLGGNHDAC